MGYRDYSTAKGHIVDATGHGDFTTVSAALAAAIVGETIFIRPGTYTENPTLKAGVNLTAFECDSPNATVTIVGELSYSVPGTLIISGINFQTNGSYAISVTGANASIVTFIDCYFTATNFTLINFTNSNAASTIQLQYGGSNLATTGIALYSMSSSGSLNFLNFECGNSGGSTTVSSNSAGSVGFLYSTSYLPVSCTGTGGLDVSYSFMDTGAQNVIPLLFNGTGGNTFYESTSFGGTASAVSIGVGAFVVINACTLQSSNTNAIAGAGTVGLGFITYTSSTGIANTLTVEYAPLQAGSTTFSGAGVTTNPLQPCFSAYLSTTQANVTGDGTVYQIPFDTVLFDQTSNFTTGASAHFTFPVAGKYQINIGVLYASVTATVEQFTLVTTAETFSSELNILTGTAYSRFISQVVSASAGDTVYAALQLSEGTKSSEVIGATPPPIYTFISGVKVA